VRSAGVRDDDDPHPARGQIQVHSRDLALVVPADVDAVEPRRKRLDEQAPAIDDAAVFRHEVRDRPRDPSPSGQPGESPLVSGEQERDATADQGRDIVRFEQVPPHGDDVYTAGDAVRAAVRIAISDRTPERRDAA